MTKRENCVRDILKEKGIKQAVIADQCGIHRERFRKIVGNRVEILGWELMLIAQALDVEERQLYEPYEIDIRTLTTSLEQDEEHLHNSTFWSIRLSAHDEESILWLRQGLQQQEYLEEGPGFAHVYLREGRILLGRAVEHIGTQPKDKKKTECITNNQLLSIRRKTHDEDKKLSRFQLDLSFSSEHPFLTAYVQSSAIRVYKRNAWHIIHMGECTVLQHNDIVLLPNRKQLRIECIRQSRSSVQLSQ